MKIIENTGWYKIGEEGATWDASEVTVFVYGEATTLCPYVSELLGPDDRFLYSVDVPDGKGGIRSLASGFVSNLEEARTAAFGAMERLACGLTAV